MAKFSTQSLERLATCDPRLQLVFSDVVAGFDCTIIEGHRGEAAQHAAFLAGKSQLDWPQGKHNRLPSRAIDVAPYPLDWQDRLRFTYFAGYVLGVAFQLGIKLRWGGDWDQDTDLADQTFQDLVHFELAE